MLVLTDRNVNGLFAQGMKVLEREGVESPSRAGPVKVYPSPVMSVYQRPCERVIFSPTRDANPFFHLMESLWMLAGRRDAKFLNNYISDFGERFADAGIVHDAYGYRWRKAMGFDQLEKIAKRLRNNPDDRQCVLQMWDSSLEGQNDLLPKSLKTRPCNTHAYFRVRWRKELTPTHVATTERGFEIGGTVIGGPVLDMTILCRSNDMIFGGYGANAVHFSMLQEYMAMKVGCEVGTMFQLSNNYHMYLDQSSKIDPEIHDHYDLENVTPMKIHDFPEEWDNDLDLFMELHDRVWGTNTIINLTLPPFQNRWFRDVATPMLISYWGHRQKNTDLARAQAASIAAPDWRLACAEWLQRRAK